MQSYFKYQPSMLLAALVTWCAVAIPSLLALAATSAWAWLPHILLLPLILLVTNESQHSYGYTVRYWLLAVMAILIHSAGFLLLSSVYLIYSVMLIAILAFYLTPMLSYCYILLASLAYLFTQTLFWERPWPWTEAGMFASFHLFSFVVSHRMGQERVAKEQAQLANSQLLATQSLLSQSVSRQERLHLARELHDDVGHQLTSLIVNLDVARRTAEEPQKSQLKQSYTLARETLEKIRTLVSDKRTEQPLDLEAVLTELISHIPRINVSLQFHAHPLLQSLSHAHCILRVCQESITNTLKHSNATQMRIEFSDSDHTQWTMTIADNGNTMQVCRPGNGLQGLQERVTELGGQFDWQNTREGFEVQVHFKEVQHHE
ncbi:two-component sensor histidine kinase [Pseudoalteromonas rubra]|uniref:Two-component sensor histidine kinase n=1 Tax=Pseudoalteromonas rubra TaxID=43658 RepID=A0A5S3WH91_9GAMM|nr:histidine kinase [Pseudoalteromonas rubra]TMP26431.1 two-component sensor histidine kinase [Pseudoalteromonas rubra]TMP29724.1 two-component sensor histidine kinase [Pseudoalteromonas rubra]